MRPSKTAPAAECHFNFAHPVTFQSCADTSEGINDGEHEEFGERDTLNQEKRAVSAEYP